MSTPRCSLVLLLAGLLVSVSALAQDAFRVSDIRLEGLQRVSAGSVFAAFPVAVGETVTPERLASATRSLFRSGLFADIRLGRIRESDDQYILVVELLERPSISKIEVDGNKNIPTEELVNALKAAGLADGEVFQRSTLERIQLEILRSYIAQGRYNALVDTEVQELERNRVQIDIQITEGPVSAIHHINIIGNQAFSDEELLDLMELDTVGWWNSLMGSDKYSKPRLNGDLERIRSWYLDRGYVQFQIDSTQVALSPDREQVFITINVSEGPRFTVRQVDLRGDLTLPESELRKLMTIMPGDVFSRRLLTQTNDLITRRLGNDGYTFASVNAIPTPHEDNTATVTFFVEPGKRTYVRRINFRGNTTTSDEVLRQELLQMESAAASTDLIESSKVRLERTGFFKTVTVETPLVAGVDDQIDVNYAVEEQSTGSLSASLGYSQSAGVILGASISERNFLGTGRQVSFGVNRSESVQSANFAYTNPYFTVDGVSRGFNISFRETDFEASDLSSYTSDNFIAGVNFGYPIDRLSRLNFGLRYNYTRLTLGEFPSQDITAFTDDNGLKYDFVEATGGWVRSSFNRGLFPTRGARTRANLTVALPELSDLAFYKVRGEDDRYWPISRSEEWALRWRNVAAYGDGYGDNDELPFFENYYAGGIGSVRGFEDNTLGRRSPPNPADPDQSGDPFGGNFLVESSFELIFPFALLEDRSQIRSSLFLDAGQVFDTFRGFDPTFDEVRFAAGLGLSWITPVGPLSFAFGRALNAQEGDDEQFFQFVLGQAL